MLVVIVIILLFAALVITHEAGHFIAAKRNGIDVEEFGIGFPPKIWGKKVGETLYSINLIPLGGFVRLAGEDTDDNRPGTFGAAKYSVKAKTLLAGVGMNMLSAVLILFVLCLVGIPALGAQFEPNFLHPTYAQPKQLILVEVESGSPAANAGLKSGDYVLRANGTPITQDTQFFNFTKAHAGQKVTLLVQEGNNQKSLAVQLRSPKSKQGFLGVETQQVYKLKYGVWQSLVAAVYITVTLFVATVVGVVQLILSIPWLILGLFSSTIPHSAEQASGPLGIFFILQAISSLGYTYIFLFMANIAVALGAFNVMPLPALDGGRLAIITYQKLAKKKISADMEARIHAIGFMALIGLIVLISVYDIRKRF
jgi:regulator of sigma E protease